ncbi:MAG: PQQ-dependent sugar dehydrogenase [Betaproteobacteria bacterium]|nr:PQQ-dependent sugar dehydrogenase [Betaproteobacteria bacterium]
MSLLRASYRGALLALAFLLGACGSGDDGGTVSVEPVLGVERVFPLLNFTSPVAMLQAPKDGARWFVVEQTGTVRVFDNAPGATMADVGVFIDIDDRVESGGEMGLLGMAFHPNFPVTLLVYLSYTHIDSVRGRVSRVSEFTSSDGGATLDPAAERVLLVIDQPDTNHNGGHLAFGPDGLLYIGMGDGGGANDPYGGLIGNGQRMTTLLGKILRIDVSPALGYAIPSGPNGNPFEGNPQCGVGGTGSSNCPEIYASGFRNPWRWSFDRQTGELWVGDVGQGALEEIDRVVRGGNYGWRCFEGTRPTMLPCGSEPNLLPPVAEYDRNQGRSVTGGYVYRGSSILGLPGKYVFGDFITGRLWYIAADAQPTLRITGGSQTVLNISSFGEGMDGELYVVHYGGQLYRLIGFS